MKEYAKWLHKGIYAVAGALGALGLALTDASPGGDSVTPFEWTQVGLAALVAAGVVVAKNGARPTKP